MDLIISRVFNKLTYPNFLHVFHMTWGKLSSDRSWTILSVESLISWHTQTFCMTCFIWLERSWVLIDHGPIFSRVFNKLTYPNLLRVSYDLKLMDWWTALSVESLINWHTPNLHVFHMTWEKLSSDGWMDHRVFNKLTLCTQNLLHVFILK